MSRHWKESYQRKILINRKHTEETLIKLFYSRNAESRKEKDKGEKYLNKNL